MIKYILFSCSLFILSCHPPKNISGAKIPEKFIGNFADDYGIDYNISDSMFVQEKKIRYYVVEWNVKDQYIIARNGAGNPSDKNLYTRIDYRSLKTCSLFYGAFVLPYIKPKPQRMPAAPLRQTA